MHHLKELNDEIESQLPFSVKSVDNFDPGFYFGGSIQTIFYSKVLVGIIYQYYTTGSRIGQKDYSGYYAFDQITNGHFVGLEPGMIVFNKKVICIAAFVQGGALFSGIKMNEDLIVGEINNTDSRNLRAFSIAITPTVKASIPIIHPLRCSLSLGRMIDTGGEVHLPKNKDAVLMINNSKVKTGWSGWRMAIELNINLMNH
ncbi:MAG: hypothetical protein WAL29_15890 [Bacteroidales bacterium]